MRVVGAHHMSLTVLEVERSKAFYGGVLGLPEIDRPDFGFPGAWYQAGPVQLHLIQAPPGHEPAATEAGPSPIENHLAFEIDDYAAVQRDLEAQGHQVLGLGENVGQLFVRDPDGHMVELIQPGGQLGRPKPA